MPNLRYMTYFSIMLYVALYFICWAFDRECTDRYYIKIKLNKYTRVLFFPWKEKRSVYFLSYIIIITESILFILLWALYILKIKHIFNIIIDIYVFVYISGTVVLAIKAFMKKIKDSKRRRR